MVRVKGMLDSGTTAEEVAKVILGSAATSPKKERNLRYIVGSDAESLTEKRS